MLKADSVTIFKYSIVVTLVMKDLVEILKEQGVGNHRNSPDDIQRIMAEGINKYLESHLVVSSHELKNALTKLIHEKVIIRNLGTSTLDSYCDSGTNPWLKAPIEFERAIISNVIKEIATEKYPNCNNVNCTYEYAAPENRSSLPRGVRKNFYNTTLFSKKREYIRRYVEERVSFKDLTANCTFNVDPKWVGYPK